MLLRHYTGEIVEGNKFVDGLLWYDENGSLVPFLAMLSILRREKPDAVVVVHPTFRLALLMWLAGVPLRIGTGYRFYSFLFNRRVYEHRKDAHRHELEYNLQLLKEVGCDAPDAMQNPEFGIEISPEAETAARAILSQAGIETGMGFVVVHPCSGGSAREWSLDNFGALAKFLIERNNLSVVVTGGTGEQAAAEAVVRATGGRAISLSGKLGLKELAALLRSARLFVSNSTGPLHLAVAVGTPVLAFYPQITSMSARRWGPYTQMKRVLVPERPADCKKCSDGKGEPCECMNSISTQQAYAAACEVLIESGRRAGRLVTHG